MSDKAGFSVREEGGQLFISGLMVPYGEQITGTPEFGQRSEEFGQGAFEGIASTLLIDTHDGVPVARLAMRETQAGWVADESPMFNTDRAREFVQLAREGAIGPSVEFAVGQMARTATGYRHTRVKKVAGIAGTYRPAYSGGSFSVRHLEGTNVTEQETPAPEPTPPAPPEIVQTFDANAMAQVAQRAADEVFRQWAARGAFNGNAAAQDAWKDLSIGGLAKRGYEGLDRDELNRIDWIKRALADTVTTAGANAGMVTPGVPTDVHGIVSRGRPAITAFGGPRSSESFGMSVLWPYFDGTLSSLVGAQSAEKAEITSAAVNIKQGTEALITYAGGSDISYQLLRKSNASYLDVYFRILLTAWGVVTDAAFVTELESGSVTSDFTEALSGVDATEFKNFVIDGSIAVQTATGLPADFVLASTTAFTQFAKLFTPITTLANTGLGTTDIRNLVVNVGNVPIIHVPSITAGKLIISNREAAAWYEEGPFQATDEDVAKLGKNVAIWSMGAGARFIPAGIIELYDVTP